MKARRDFLIALGGGTLAIPLASFAQQPRKVWRIAFLTPAPSETNPNQPNAYGMAFVQEMQAAGYAFGVDYSIEVRSADGDYDRLPALAAELVRQKVDILVPVSPIAVDAAYTATRTVPIVCAGAHDPVAMGMAASLARPGGNLTGLVTFYGDLIPKHLELVKSIVPKASRVAILAKPGGDRYAAIERRAYDAAEKLGLRLQLVPMRSTEELPRVFAEMTRGHARAFIAIADASILRDRRQVAELALKHRLPSIFASKENVVAGGLASYGEDFIDLFAQAARFASKIMKGAKPGDLPMEQPTRFHLAINRKTAAALKLAIPQELLLRADEVIG